MNRDGGRSSFPQVDASPSFCMIYLLFHRLLPTYFILTFSLAPMTEICISMRRHGASQDGSILRRQVARRSLEEPQLATRRLAARGHGQRPWPLVMAMAGSQDMWPGPVAHGQLPWAMAVGNGHGLYPLPMATGHGHCPRPLGMASGQGQWPWTARANGHGHWLPASGHGQ